MKLLNLSLHDYRGFEALDLPLEPDITVLVGVNGAGKTSILDAVALLASCLTEGIRGEGHEPTGLRLGDVREGASTGRAELVAEIEGQTVRWALSRTKPGHGPVALPEVTELTEVIKAAQATFASGSPTLPLMVYFPTNRSVLDIPARIRTPHEFNAVSAYDGALEDGASNFRGFFEWFREEEDIYNEQEEEKRQPSIFPKAVVPSRLPAVRAAIEKVLPRVRHVRIQRKPQRMLVEFDGAWLDVAQLSDGMRCLLALAGDLARRMLLVAPNAENPLHHPAIVLIDEIELHLHPGLQREILPGLRAVFPNTQFLVTTHSPQILSSVHATNVRILERFALRRAERGTWRRDTNRILESVFGDPGRPREVAEVLAKLSDAFDDDRFDEARRLIDEISGMVEGVDPDVFYYEQRLPSREEGEPEAAS